jgi:putative transposase
MPRRARSIVGGYAYHVLNRANGRLRLFKKDADFAAFEEVLAEAFERVPLRILGYAVLGNHWHFVVWPRQRQDAQVTDFFRWLTHTHTQRWHAHHGTSGMGHVYQGRFKSFPIAADEHLLAVLRYVERNPLRAGLVERAEQWRWGSLYRRVYGTPEERAVLAESPVPLGRLWRDHVNKPQNDAELAAIRRCVARGRPFGGERWRSRAARRLGLEYTFRPRGRPRKQPPPSSDAEHPKNNPRPL